jgi:L-amino acid N-acyltransferase YncA
MLVDPRVSAWVGVADRPIGFGRLDIGPDRIAEVTLAVAPDQRRSGSGRALLRHLVEQCRTLRVRRLHAMVDRLNPAGLDFFRDCGFEEDGHLGGAVRMVRWVHNATTEALEIDG